MKTEYTVIEIVVDGVWAGSGKLRGDMENGHEIVDCGAQFCDDNDESIAVYDDIENAIDNGEDSIKFRGQTISWKITVPTAS
jgi:hypothetical protein